MKEQVKEERLQKSLGCQGLHWDADKFFEPNTKAFTHSNAKIIEESKSTTEAISQLTDTLVFVKAFQLLKKSEKIGMFLLKP